MTLNLEASLAEDECDFFGGKAEAAMLMLLAQKFVRVRREVDDEQPSTGTKCACCLTKCASGIVEVMKHLMEDDEIIGVRLHWQGVKIALAEMDIAQTTSLDHRPGDVQHCRAEIHADRAHSDGRKDFQHTPGPCSQVQNSLKPSVAHDVPDRVFHLCFGHVQGSDLVPITGLRGEVSGSAVSPSVTYLFKANPVRGDQGVVGVHAPDNIVGHLNFRSSLRQMEEGPSALAVAFHHA